MAVVHKFYKKNLKPFQKPWFQKEVQTLKYGHSLGVVANLILKIPPVCHVTKLQVTFIGGNNWNLEFTCIGKAVYSEIQDCYYGKNHT